MPHTVTVVDPDAATICVLPLAVNVNAERTRVLEPLLHVVKFVIVDDPPPPPLPPPLPFLYPYSVPFIVPVPVLLESVIRINGKNPANVLDALVVVVFGLLPLAAVNVVHDPGTPPLFGAVSTTRDSALKPVLS
jgi:hypothetical protein